MSITAALKEVFHYSLAKRLWLYFLIVFVISYIIAIIILSLTLGLAINLLFGSIASEQNPLLAIQKILSDPVPIITGLAIVFIVYFFLLLVVGSVFQGIQFNGSRAFLEGTREIGELFRISWLRTKPRIVTAILYNLFINIISLIVFAILFAPAVIAALPVLSGNFQAVSNAIVLFIISIIILLLLFLLLSPFLALLLPVLYFEKLGVFGTIKRAFSLGKKNYFRNLLYLLLFGLIVIAAIFLGYVLFILGIFTLVFLIGIVFILLGIIYFIVLLLWLQPFTFLAMIKLYDLCAETPSTATTMEAVEIFPKPVAKLAKKTKK